MNTKRTRRWLRRNSFHILEACVAQEVDFPPIMFRSVKRGSQGLVRGRQLLCLLAHNLLGWTDQEIADRLNMDRSSVTYARAAANDAVRLYHDAAMTHDAVIAKVSGVLKIELKPAH